MNRFLFAIAIGWVSAALGIAADPKRLEWTVGDAKREALVYLPAKATSTPAPLVFVWHGHGGSMKNAERTFAIHKHWPEAVVVYAQGLPTPGKLTDPEGKKAGWQHSAGDQKDRDLKFFDEMLKSLRKDYKVDEKRVYSTGHSNGGGFTYLLWANRGDEFAAVAPSAAVFAGFRNLKAKPCLHVAGEADSLVKYAWQQKMMDAVQRINGCEADGKEWADAGKLVGTVYPSKGGTPFVALLHPGNHTFPADAPELIVKFFREHARK